MKCDILTDFEDGLFAARKEAQRGLGLRIWIGPQLSVSISSMICSCGSIGACGGMKVGSMSACDARPRSW